VAVDANCTVGIGSTYVWHVDDDINDIYVCVLVESIIESDMMFV
jgi:hypothetical protein